MSDNTLAAGTLLQGKTYRYEIRKVLGQGSFGITYLAAIQMSGELGAIDAYVAIKEFFMSDINGRTGQSVTASSRDGLFDKYKRKFVNEARSLARLQDPGIVRVLEEFEANNTVYYAMSFIDGGSLDAYIAGKGRLTERETLSLARQVLDSLAYMHSRRMLHLDLKPSNIMMHQGRPVLIDFGLSKQYDSDGRPESSTTVGGGTPGYSPIEQTNYAGEKNDSGRLPVQMDMYALGATMYNMLTGSRPPLAADVLNYGFPDGELRRLGVSEHTIATVRRLMSPLWQDRPADDAQARQMLDDTSGTAAYPDSHAGTRRGASATIPRSGDRTRQDATLQPAPSGSPRRRSVWVIASVLLVLAAAAVAWFIVYGAGRNHSSAPGPSPVDSLASDTAAAEAPLGPNITYKVSRSDGIYDPDAQLLAVIDGEEVVIGSVNYIFGNDNNGNMQLFAQEDFDGDGVREALVYDANPGSGGGTTWAFVSYAGDSSFEKSNLFSEASYYDPVLAEADGRKVLDFVTTDMGEKVVRERHALRDGNAVALDLPKARTQSYAPLKTIDMAGLGEDGSFAYDLDGDGSAERMTTTGSYHFGRSFELTMHGRTYNFDLYAMWGAGKLHILKSRTRGMHDLMVETDSRYVYRWDGSTYVTPDGQ